MRINTQQRRFDLDWLRVGAFALLILYHVGMFYVPWGWHVKSEHAPVDALRLPMLLTNPWRLPLLFFVSGVALRFALDKHHNAGFLAKRTYRLIVPFLFGMWVICAPQAYYELVQGGHFSGSVLEFYRGYATVPWLSPESWPIITPTWNHLWYLLYVLLFSLLIGAASVLSARRFDRLLDNALGKALRFQALALLCTFPLLLLLIRYVLNDSYGAQQTLWGDWYNVSVSFLTLLFGYAVAKQDAFWVFLKNKRSLLLILALAGACLIVWNYYQSSFGESVRAVVRMFFSWYVLFALLGYAQVLLNRDSATLRYLSAAIFPFYVLHQTLIIVVGVNLTKAGLPFPVESLLLLLSTFAGCAVLYHWVVRPMGRWGVIVGSSPARGES